MDEDHALQLAQMEQSVAMFFSVHDDPDDPQNYEPPLAGGDDQLRHLASWLLGEGWRQGDPVSTVNHTDVTYEVHERKVGSKKHKTRGIAGGAYGLARRESAQTSADEFNAEEVANAKMELRRVKREYVVVRATTTYDIA
jgi:hypothetical protein